MYPAEQTRPDSYKHKKLAVLVLIGIAAALLLMNVALFVYSRSVSTSGAYISSISGFGAAWLITERALEILLLGVEAFLVFRQHYIGCTICLVLKLALFEWSFKLAFTTGAWYIWLIMPFDVMHLVALALVWWPLYMAHLEALSEAAIRDLCRLPIKVTSHRDGSSTSGTSTFGGRATRTSTGTLTCGRWY